MKGWGPKSSVCPSKPRETKLFGGISRDFWRDIPRAPEKLKKNICVQFSDPSLIEVSRMFIKRLHWGRLRKKAG